MTAAAPPLDALLGSSTTLIVPGIARWLGVSETPRPDGPEDALEAYCAHLSTTNHTTQGGPA